MKPDTTIVTRLQFLVRVTEKECRHLLDTDQRLFSAPFSVEVAQQIDANPILAERLDAFVSRFGRLQDTVGDKLLPTLLSALAETLGPAIDNLDKAEKFGFIDSVDVWMEMRKLRNQMVHEYIEDFGQLTSALQTGHAHVPQLVSAARQMLIQAEKILASDTSA